jgi:hypothetical protein
MTTPFQIHQENLSTHQQAPPEEENAPDELQIS